MNSDLRRSARSDGVAPTRDGTRIAYTLHGDSEARRRRVALVHSLAMDRQFWQPVAELLARNATVLTYDCRGHGASGQARRALHGRAVRRRPRRSARPSRLGLGAGRRRLDGRLRRARLRGRLSGARRALGLIDTTAWYGADAPKNWAERADKAVKKGLGSLVDFQTTRWFGDKFRAEHPDVVKQCVDVFLRNDVKAYVETCTMLGVADLRAALSRADHADGGRRRRGGLRDAGRDGARRCTTGIAGSTLHAAAEGAPSHAARSSRRSSRPSSTGCWRVPRHEIYRRAHRQGAARGGLRGAARCALLRLLRRGRARPCGDSRPTATPRCSRPRSPT